MEPLKAAFGYLCAAFQWTIAGISAFFARVWPVACWVWRRRIGRWPIIIGALILVYLSPLIWWYRFDYRSEPASGKPEGIHLLAGTDVPDRQGDVILVHGLEGDCVSTWKASGSDFFWPADLASIGNIGVWSVQYGAASTEWAGTTMPLTERSISILEQLVGKGLGQRNTVFVGHSLGGLVIKQALKEALILKKKEWVEIADNTEAVVFLATPHTGSGLASYVNKLAWAVRPSLTTVQLLRDDSNLRELNIWYRNNIPGRDTKTHVYYETLGIGHLWWNRLVVEAGSADIGVNGVIPIPVTANHFTICKPTAVDNDVYVGIRAIVKENVLPLDPSYKITFEEFADEFSNAKKTDTDLQKSKATHVGQTVKWKARVRRSWKPRPTLDISPTDDDNDDHRVIAEFRGGLFPDPAVGAVLEIEGRISPDTDKSGVILLKCRPVSGSLSCGSR